MIDVRILIVEDNDSKYRKVAEKLQSHLSAELSLKLERAPSTFSAIEKYNKQFFDVIILDLSIPLNDGNGPCNIEHSKEFYEYVLRSERGQPFLIVGLTVYPPTAYKELFEAHPIFSVENYRAAKWSANIASRIRQITMAKSALSRFLENNHSYDVIVLVARYENEYLPIKEVIPWLNEPDKNPRLGERSNCFGSIRTPSGTRLSLGIVCLGEMGLSVSAAIASQLINMFRPRYFAMLGMCCGFKDERMAKKTKLGDLIIARNTANWDEGKYATKDETTDTDPYFHHRAVEKQFYESSEGKLVQILERKKGKVQKEIRNYYESSVKEEIDEGEVEFPADSNIHFDLILSGSSVVDNAKMIDEIRDRFSASVGLEMEAHSVYSAVDAIFGVKPTTLVIKGVADHGDGGKLKYLQKYASAASYLVFQNLLFAYECEID